jgi:light-regulated signal transduction histidine kinase (bacteriophytochrome)
MDLTVKVWPRKEYLAGMRSLLPGVILASGILVSALLALVGYFAEKAQRRARTAETANSKLELEITERKRIEEELQRNCELIERNTRELKRSNAELEQFASVASHDLREPLRVISGYLRLLSRRYKGKLDRSADEFIEFAVDGSARMQNIINDLLAFSRLGSREKTFAPVNCVEVLQLTRRHLSTAIEESGAVITHDPLPTVTADASQLGQLFMNLVGNSIKYRGDEIPSIHVSTKESDEEWLFLLTDNGIGFDMQHSEKVFEMFKRLHGVDKYSGTGIGLAICKKVVENHNGRIWVESQPGAGSTFFFTIPKKW